MAIRNIIKMGDPALRKVSKPVTEFNEKLGELFDDLKETLDRAGGLGLAAVQTGVLKRAFVIILDGKHYEIANPVIISQKGSAIDNEGCLSVVGFRGMVKRAQSVEIEYYDRKGKKHKLKAENYEARAVLHEYDHLEGVLFCDKMSEKIEDKKS